VALIVTPGSASPCVSTTCPEMVPPVVCAAAVAAAKIVAAMASHALTGLMKLLLETCASSVAGVSESGDCSSAQGGADDVPVAFCDSHISYTLNTSVKRTSGCSSTGQWL